MTEPITGTGSGRYALRFQIAGMPYEAVTDYGMEQLVGGTPLTGGTARTVGLQREGIEPSYDVDMKTAELTVSPITVRIADLYSRSDAVATPWTKLFSKKPSARTWIDATCTDIDTTITVRDTSLFPSAGVLYIDQETITYSGVTSTTFTGCTRGVLNTIPTYHYSLDDLSDHAAEVTDWPATMEGRRCWIYTYGASTPLTGDGTQLWIGQVSRDARLVDATTWEIGVDPVTTIFNQSVGGELAVPIQPRGIYYPWNACLYLAVYVSSDSTPGNLPSTPTWTLQLTGFYESQELFVQQLNTQIAALATTKATGLGLIAVSDGPSGWHFELHTDSATPRWVGLYCVSPVDSTHYANSVSPLWNNAGTAPDTTTIGTGGAVATSTTYQYQQTPSTGFLTSGTVVGPKTYTGAVVNSGSVPRGSFIHADASGADYSMPWFAINAALVTKSSAATSAPGYRVYLDGYGTLDGLDSFTIQYGDDGPSVTSGLLNHSNASRYIDLLGPSTPALQAISFAGVGSDVVFHPTRYFAAGTLHELRAALIASVPAGAPAGNAPYIYDVTLSGSTTLSRDFGTWDAALTASAGRAVAQRQWAATKAQRVGEIIREEAKNLGCFFALDANGRIELYQVGIAPTSTTWTINTTSELTDKAPSGWERNQDGVLGRIIISTDYDPLKDEWTGVPIPFQLPAAIGRNPLAQPIEIKPRSQIFNPTGAALSPANDYAVILAGVFGVYAAPYAIVTVDVPFTFLTAILGDTVTITSKNLPKGDGTRGMASRSGVIVGKRVSFAESAITLRILVSEVNYSGYTPTSRISGSLNTGGFKYTLTIAAPAGTGATRSYSDGTAWKSGDLIRVVVWDSTTSTTQSGTVTADGTATQVLVTLAGAIPGGTINLEYDRMDAGTWTANQLQYAAVAPATDVLQGALPAKQFI